MRLPEGAMFSRIAVSAISGAFAVGLALCPDSTRAGPNKVSCDGFDLAFDGPAITKDCSEETYNQGRFTGEAKQILVTGPDFLLNLIYLAAGHNQYFFDVPPRDTFTS